MEAAVAHLASTLAAENEAAPTLLLSIRSDYPGEWQRFLAGDPLTIPVARNRFSYIAQGRTIAVQSMALVSLDAAAPVPAAVSASEVGLDALPAFAPSQQDEVLLQFAADSSLIERDAEADPYLLLHYAIQ